MKKQITAILLFANFLLSFSQAPQAVTYQAVVRIGRVILGTAPIVSYA